MAWFRFSNRHARRYFIDAIYLQEAQPLAIRLRSSYTLSMNYQDYITIDPNKRGGKPCVRGLRITVHEVLDYLASDMTEEEFLEDFPDLTKEDLAMCTAFEQ